MQTGPAISISLEGGLGTFRLAVAFEAPMQGITALFGPSGCGKTTVLRCLAGLQKLPGRIVIGDEIWQDAAARIFQPAHRRHVGYVFQEASLFPHLSVRDNLLYGARRVTGGDPPGRAFGLDEIVEMLGIAHLLARAPENLSGGERQRVAIGRALLSHPRILLMDEPISALDRTTRDEILPYLEKLHETLSLPVIYVSHDLTEIERLADTLVLMDSGRVLAAGRLSDLQSDPRLPLLAAAGAAIVIEGRVAAIDRDFALTTFVVPGGTIVAAGMPGSIGETRRLRISTTDVSLTRQRASETTILNCLPARITSIEHVGAGPQVEVMLALGLDGEGARMTARITRKSLETLALTPGEQIIAQIKGVAILAARSRPGPRVEDAAV